MKVLSVGTTQQMFATELQEVRGAAQSSARSNSRSGLSPHFCHLCLRLVEAKATKSRKQKEKQILTLFPGQGSTYHLLSLLFISSSQVSKKL